MAAPDTVARPRTRAPAVRAGAERRERPRRFRAARVPPWPPSRAPRRPGGRTRRSTTAAQPDLRRAVRRGQPRRPRCPLRDRPDPVGRIDVVVANAGRGSVALLGAITEEQFDSAFAVNVKGALFTVQKALPLLGTGPAPPCPRPLPGPAEPPASTGVTVVADGADVPPAPGSPARGCGRGPRFPGPPDHTTVRVLLLEQQQSADDHVQPRPVMPSARSRVASQGVRPGSAAPFPSGATDPGRTPAPRPCRAAPRSAPHRHWASSPAMARPRARRTADNVGGSFSAAGATATAR
jgi:NAD(P)-dependent dehydrogenase (short-subunit alcohol dehydrogenase family)